jgi:hypothetical protein
LARKAARQRHLPRQITFPFDRRNGEGDCERHCNNADYMAAKFVRELK